MSFSIIVPVYNSELTIRRCLESLQNQSFSDFEAILINDGSQDNSGDICKALAESDTRFKYVEQENRGVSAARNVGIQSAEGDFIVFLDSDDSYESEYLQSFYEVIQSNPNCDNYWCGYRSVSENSGECDILLWCNESVDIVSEKRSRIMDFQRKELFAPLWNKVFRREIVEEYHLRMDEAVSLGEDLLFNYAYLDACREQICIINQPLYCYTKSENGSLNTRYRENLKELYETLDESSLPYLVKWGVSDNQLSSFYQGVLWHYVHVLHNTYRLENRMSSAEKLKYNLSVMSDARFQISLKKAGKCLHPLYRFAYWMRSWYAVMLLDSLARWKGRGK